MEVRHPAHDPTRGRGYLQNVGGAVALRLWMMFAAACRIVNEWRRVVAEVSFAISTYLAGEQFVRY